MRKADRLFRITELLKSKRRAVTAKELAEVLEVSVRTIYRDMSELMTSHVPITGEAGTGYMLDKRYIVKPMMFDSDELDALLLGAQMVESWGDKALAKSARQAIDKICASIPNQLQHLLDESVLFSLPSQARPVIHVDFALLRKAVRNKRFTEFQYRKEDGERSLRRIRPLALAFFGPVWLLLGWCETRQAFRNFRVDRMNQLTVSEDTFQHERGKTLQDYMQTVNTYKPLQPY